MIMAIFVVVLIALGGTLILRNASTGSKSIGDNYLRTQAELLADSAIEFASMQMQDINTSNGTCLNGLNISVRDQGNVNTMFDINTTLAYSFFNPVVGSTAGCNKLAPDKIGTSGNSMVLINVTVTTNTNANLSTEPIRVHKQSWQKL